MNHTHQNHNHSIGTSFMTHGLQGIDMHHRTSQRMAEANTYQVTNDLRRAGATSGLRHRIGGMMIALGAAIAGKTHDLQERQATMPSPSSAKSGFVPTR